MPAVAQKRALKVHPKMLFDVIFRQAGTLSKALLEAVMNSVDAEANACRITCTEDSSTIVIEDDGKGILKEEHVEKWFENFGQPHEESEKKVFGSFRMGRGQLFSYGVNTWRTGPWLMKVDVKKDGLAYELTKQPQSRKGCRIEIKLYEPMSPVLYQETSDCLAAWVQYAPIGVFWNDEKLNTDPSFEKWDHVTPEAYIRLNSTGSLAVYNLGIHTLDYASYRYGTGGVVVSREQLKVNFARNDVQGDCPVWRKILPLIKVKTRAKLLKKTQLTDGERQNLARQILSGELEQHEAMRQKVVTSVSGRHFELYELERAYAFQGRITVCPAGNQLGDKLMQRKTALVVSQDTLERFGVKSLQALEAKIRKRHPGFKLAKVVPFADLTKGMNDKYVTLDAEQLRPNEKLWQTIAESLYYRLTKHQGEKYDRSAQRRIVIGTGPADGWTDGLTYVALARNFLGGITFDMKGLSGLSILLLHEACHMGPDTAEHTHTQEFYEAYHDLSRAALPELTAWGLGDMQRSLKRSRDRLPRVLLVELQRQFDLTEERKKLQEQAATRVKILVKPKAPTASNGRTYGHDHLKTVQK